MIKKPSLCSAAVKIISKKQKTADLIIGHPERLRIPYTFHDFPEKRFR